MQLGLFVAKKQKIEDKKSPVKTRSSKS